ncbi:fanconi-associated nuclease 1 [Sporothrix brasiliensis 5110]|uniref:Fanconi-associated nuclease n=1 Tax=Sporothrix brasiliensis 5110 TaxID=1398154 RepID=A0A0C2IXI2_9PEZI|nr:fanconi-associated nuclease 1 [Sporothrix brasiliensis 5110]KIH89717.1 fanconi-associated nuclease 1 [Sporothrix brasiliensis 5110]
MDKFLVRRARPSSSTPSSRDRERSDEKRVKRTKLENDDTSADSGNEHVLLDYLKCEEEEDDAADSGRDLELVAGSCEAVPFEEPLAAIEATDEVIDDSYGATDGAATDGPTLYRSSIYVDAFNIALDTVLEQEEHLFNEKEKAVFSAWRSLDYEAQYLYVRLFLRKEAAWHRTQRLSYRSNIGDLQAAIETLQKEHQLPLCEDDVRKSPLSKTVPQDWALGDTFVFAQMFDNIDTTVEEAVSLLSLDELKTLAKQMKAIGKTKTELQAAIIHMATRQRTLMSAGLRRHSTADSAPGTPATPGTPVPERRRDSTASSDRGEQLIEKVAAITGPCIRICPSVFRLFERVHLVFYRTTEWTEKSLTTIVLAKMSKRNFPDYIVSRTANIFESRQQLLDFEEALRLEHRVDHILNVDGKEDGFRDVVSLFHSIADHWRALLKDEKRRQDETDIGGSGDESYLRRFKAAHVFTRIAHYAAHCFGRLHEYVDEYALIQELLDQRLLHLARRGSWYQRKALLEERYMATAASNPKYKDEDQQKKYWWRKALETCEQALQDRDCHLIYHFDLQKRTLKLEKRLRIPRRLQHDFGHARLLAPEEHFVEGVQIKRDEGVLPHLTRKPNSGSNPDGTVSVSSVGFGGGMSTKTVWVDEQEAESKGDGAAAECSVEEMCLNEYRKQGWKGYHSEGGIVRTLFAYLFYDILFLFIPNVFQTPYQACPLDLHTDTFYPSRASEINRRLAEIANGEAPRIVREVHAAHFERRTCIVGLQWDFPLEDVVELTQGFRGDALALVCKVLAQEYRQRGGGLPDLLLWRTEPTPEVLFSEVKSANDRLSDTQRMWIHVLAGAGVRVAVCHAIAKQVRVKS